MSRTGLVAGALLLVLALGACESVQESLNNIRPPELPPPEAPPEATTKGLRSPMPAGPKAVVLTPAGAVGGAAQPLVSPVRLQIGPQPFVVESCSMKPGDRVQLLIRVPGAEEAVHSREYSWSGGLSTVGEAPPDWDGEPGEYEAELWVNGELRDRRPFVVN